MRALICFLLPAFAFLTSCATQKESVPVALHEQFASVKVISSVEPISVVRQRRVFIHGPGRALDFGLLVSLPAGLAAGAVFGIVDLFKLDKAKEFADSYKGNFEKALGKLEFQRDLDNSIKSSLTSLKWNIGEIESREGELTKDQLKATLQSLQEDALLVLTSAYNLTAQLESLEIYTEVNLYARPQNQSKLSSSSRKPVFTALLKSQSPMVVPRIRLLNSAELADMRRKIIEYHNSKISKSHDRGLTKYWRDRKQERLQRLENEKMTIIAKEYTATQGEALWLANGATLLFDAIANGISEQTQLLKLALSMSGEEDRAKETKVGIPAIQTFPSGIFSSRETRVEKAKVNGWLLHQNAKARYFLTNYGIMVSIINDDALRPVVYIQ